MHAQAKAANDVPDKSERREVVLKTLFGIFAVAFFIIIQMRREIAEGIFPDPDDALRLVQVRDLLAGQNWFDLHQYRIDPANGGVLMHWSRLVDLPLAGMIMALRPLLGPAGAEQVTLVAVPLITLAAAMALSALTAVRLAGREAALPAALFWGLAASATAQFRPMRIDHHGWQIVAVLAAAALVLGSRPARDGRLAGIAVAFALAISIEVLPIAALFAAVLAIGWLVERGNAPWLPAYLEGLAGALAVLTLLTKGPGELLMTHCDAASGGYVAALIVAAAGIRIAAQAAPRSRTAITAALGAAGAAAGLTLMALAPQCRRGPFGSLDPLVHEFWYEKVTEGLPVWTQSPQLAAQMVLPVVAGLGACWLLYRRGDSRLWANPWLRLGLLAGGCLAQGILVSRSTTFASALAIVPLACAYPLAFAWIGSVQTIAARAALGLGLACLLFPILPVYGAVQLLGPGPAELSGTGVEKTVEVGYACAVNKPGNPLYALAPATLFAPLDIGADIIVRTPHRVVATGHHRGAAAMRDVIAAFTGTPAQAESLVRGHRADHVLVCKTLFEMELYAKGRPGSLAAALLAGRPPAWLDPHPVVGDGGNLLIYRVVPPEPPPGAQSAQDHGP